MILILSSGINIDSLVRFNASSTAFFYNRLVKFPHIVFNKEAFIIFVFIPKPLETIICVMSFVYI